MFGHSTLMLTELCMHTFA